MLSALIYLLIILLVIGALIYLVARLPLPPPVLVVAQVILALVGLLLALRLLGVVPGVVP